MAESGPCACVRKDLVENQRGIEEEKDESSREEGGRKKEGEIGRIIREKEGRNEGKQTLLTAIAVTIMSGMGTRQKWSYFGGS